MEFNEKLQWLRKQRKLTQEELASSLCISRTAVSKWESGRGYPSIDSLKIIAEFFGVTVDELLSGEELLNIAEQDSRQKQRQFRDLVFGLFDVSASMLLFLPFFAQRSGGEIKSVSLLLLTSVSPYLKIVYFVLVVSIIVVGILTLALQNCNKKIWLNCKEKISLLLNATGAIIFIVSLQSYAATFLFIFLMIKLLIITKKQ